MSKNKSKVSAESVLEVEKDLEADPEFAEAVQREIERQAQQEASRAALLDVLKDPKVAKYEAELQDLTEKISQVQAKRDAIAEQVNQANREIQACTRELDALIAKRDHLKLVNRNDAANNVAYIEAQQRARETEINQHLARRNIALKLGLITAEEYARAKLSPIDIAIAAKNEASRQRH